MKRPRRLIAVIAVLLGMACAGWLLYSRWQHVVAEREFRATLPADHYDIALRLLNPRAYRMFHPEAKTLSVSWGRDGELKIAATRDDVKSAIRHLEAIPAPAPEYKSANELLPYLRAVLDRPQEFEAMVQVRLESCGATMRAPYEALNKSAGRCIYGVSDRKTGKCYVVMCGNAVWDGCTPLKYLPMDISH